MLSHVMSDFKKISFYLRLRVKQNKTPHIILKKPTQSIHLEVRFRASPIYSGWAGPTRIRSGLARVQPAPNRAGKFPARFGLCQIGLARFDCQPDFD